MFVCVYIIVVVPRLLIDCLMYSLRFLNKINNNNNAVHDTNVRILSVYYQYIISILLVPILGLVCLLTFLSDTI